MCRDYYVTITDPNGRAATKLNKVNRSIPVADFATSLLVSAAMVFTNNSTIPQVG